MDEKPKPVKVGDVVELECISQGKKGDGIFKIDGFVIMAPNAKQGELCRLKIIRVLPRFAIGEMMVI